MFGITDKGAGMTRFSLLQRHDVISDLLDNTLSYWQFAKKLFQNACLNLIKKQRIKYAFTMPLLKSNVFTNTN